MKLQILRPCVSDQGEVGAPGCRVIALFGEASLTHLLVLSQVVLSLQLPFAVVPLVQFCSRRLIMGPLVAPFWLKATAIAVAAFLIVLDIALLANMLGELL